MDGHIPWDAGRGKWADQFEALDENGTGSAGSQALMGQFRDAQDQQTTGIEHQIIGIINLRLFNIAMENDPFI